MNQSVALRGLTRYEEARAHLTRALALQREARDERGAANSRVNLGLVLADLEQA